MVLYHITYDLGQDEEHIFVPRIPEEKIEQDEDITIPRICFADTIENCIRAVNGYPRDEANYIRVYELEVDPNDNDLMSWEELYINGYVNDVELTHEFWYLKPVKMKSRVYKITSFDVREFIVVAQELKTKIVSAIIDDFDVKKDVFGEMSASYILNDWIKDIGRDAKNIVLKSLQYEEEYVEEGDPELHYQIFGEYPKVKKRKVNEYYNVHMVTDLEVVEVKQDREFIIDKCQYYEMLDYVRKNQFELCWDILDPNYVWNNAAYLYKVKNLTGKLIALLYCSEHNGRYMIAKYEVLSQYRNKGYGGKIIEDFFEQEKIEKNRVDLIPESEDAARFWRAHGIDCSVC